MDKTNKKLKPWQKSPPVSSVILNMIEPRQSFLIICEGEETERRYFEAFRATKKVRDFEVRGLGRNTLSLVQYAITLRKDLEDERGNPFDQAWCVFDRDDFPPQQFNAAITLAQQKGFQVAYSNEAFEIWYLLHFDFHNAAITRQLYREKLSEKFGYHYEKNSVSTYSTLQRLGNEEQAMRFAARLLQTHHDVNGRLNPEADTPSTTVHLLVRELRDKGEGKP